ncbi:MAG TPA: branched-chain amino acid ABC transporter permease [Syntrophales bacterium]|nr:branched-chain amino acid ABC transporter permease [Syntrophales bacterium]HOL58364.1 branched-chain amino acid ABC transporter permease [Syntrophales bacterium]HPO34533.1 branched-chain amino acid ABC transporter permease [Syntrophales bacterium]
MKKTDRILFVAFALGILSLPMILQDSYLLHVFVFIGIHTMLAVALNLLLGYAGQISLGQGALFGLGAYLSAILSTKYSLNPWIGMLVAAFIVSVIAYVVGFPILKLRGHYLAMATLGLGIILYIVFNETVEWTGGPSGLPGIPNLKVGALVFDQDRANYYLIWAFALVTMFLAFNLYHSRIGRALRAVSDSEVASRMMGIDAWVLKVKIFTVAAFISSLAGSLYAHTMTFIAPASFGFNFSVEILTMVVVGGLGSVFGSFLGAAILTLLPEWLRVFQDLDIVIYGLLLILIMMFMPQGLVGIIKLLKARVYAENR